MARDLKGRVIAITGASAGIGAATAVEAGRCGMRVVVAARRRDRLQEVAKQVEAAGGESLVVECDVADEAQVDAMVDTAVERFGTLDAMFANAGFGFMQAADATGREADERAVWATNYFGTVACCRAAVAVMKPRGSGHVLVCSSIVGKISLPYYSTYAATKAAQDAYCAALRLEVEPFGIDVSGVYPVGTKTEFSHVSAALSGRDGIAANTPEFMMQSAEHVARRVIACLRRPRPEVWPSRLGHWATALLTLSPRLHHLGFRGHTRKCRATFEVAERERNGNNGNGA